MSPLNANDRISLDDDVDIKPSNLSEDATKKNLFLMEILSNPANLEIVYQCEGCGEDLRTPILMAYAASDDEPRDASMFCKEMCTP